MNRASAAMADVVPSAHNLDSLRAVVPPVVVHRSFVAETVLLNVETGYYHGLDEVGGTFFERLQESSTLGEAAARLAEEYAQPVQRIQEDLAAFCAELQERGLVALEPA
jgi:Coenzyme PQQ synthesis protein D (PqqD)